MGAHIGLSTSSQRHCTRPPTPPDLLLAVVSPDDARRQSHASPECALPRSGHSYLPQTSARTRRHSLRATPRLSRRPYITLATFTVSLFCSCTTLYTALT